MITVAQLDNRQAVQREVVAWRDRQHDLIYCQALHGTFRKQKCIERQENLRPYLRDWSLREVQFMRNPYLAACEGCPLFYVGQEEKPNPKSRVPKELQGIGLTQLGFDRKRQRSKDLRAAQRKADDERRAHQDWLSQWRSRRAAQQKAER